MSDEIYSIINLDKYAEGIRKAAADSISEDTSDNLDEYVTVEEVIEIIKKNCLGFDDNNRPMLGEKENNLIFEQCAEWIHNIGLSKLAAKDLIECAWDSELNEMVFWKK